MLIRSKLRNSIISFLLVSIAGCANQERDRKEQVLKKDLYDMRTAIDQYTQDKSKAPQHLDDLVTAGYLHAIPKDPFTNSATTWVEVREDALQSVDRLKPGISDVRSGSGQTSRDGSRYRDW